MRKLLYSPWQTLGVPFALTPIGQLHQSPPSPVPGDLGRCHWKLVDNFSHESDVTSLQDPFLCFPGIEPMFDRCVCFGLLFTLDDDLGRTFILPYRTFSSADTSNLLIPINGLFHVGQAFTAAPHAYKRSVRSRETVFHIVPFSKCMYALLQNVLCRERLCISYL